MVESNPFLLGETATTAKCRNITSYMKKGMSRFQKMKKGFVVKCTRPCRPHHPFSPHLPQHAQVDDKDVAHKRLGVPKEASGSEDEDSGKEKDAKVVNKGTKDCQLQFSNGQCEPFSIKKCLYSFNLFSC